MNIYNAILLAADQIEGHPEAFDFLELDIPKTCGTPGCALGWIGFFIKIDEVIPKLLSTANVIDVACLMDGRDPKKWLGADSLFYSRMDSLCDKDWEENAAQCASGLRIYAEKYHAPARPVKTEMDPVLASMLKGFEKVFETA